LGQGWAVVPRASPRASLAPARSFVGDHIRVLPPALVMAPSASMSAMAGVVGSVTTDTDHISVVDRWMDSRGEMDRWQAPIHEVNDDDWQKNFRFSEALGSGGFGVVTRATHIKTGTDVAIKMVYDRTDDGKPSAKSESVRREIETMRRMDHPHIVSLIEVFILKPVPQHADPNAPWLRRWYLVLEFCRGSDLQHLLLKRGALDLDDMREIFGQLAHAIQYTHWRGVIHRDIKPGNVMLIDPGYTGGRIVIKLLDFGLAELLDEKFIKFYRKSARRRYREANLQLPDAFENQDSVHPRRGGPTRNGLIAIGLALPPIGISRRGGENKREKEDDDDDDSYHGYNGSKEGTPYVKKELRTISERRGSEGRETHQTEKHTPQPPTFELPVAKKKSNLNWLGGGGPPSPSRMGADFVPTGTREFAAPEVFEAARFRKSQGAVGGLVEDVVVPTPMVVDSYSLGVLLRYTLTGVPPDSNEAVYVGMRRYNPIVRAIAGVQACGGKQPMTLRLLSELPEDARELVMRLTEADYHKRMTMGELINHPWLIKRMTALPAHAV